MIDRTTKNLLSIIALALIWIGVQLTPTATAAGDIQRVDIVMVGGKYVDRTVPVEVVK